MAKYRILALDGGGLRSLITVRLLQQLSDSPSISGWLDQVDLVAGTSSGGIIALGLAAGVPHSTARNPRFEQSDGAGNEGFGNARGGRDG